MWIRSIYRLARNFRAATHSHVPRSHPLFRRFARRAVLEWPNSTRRVTADPGSLTTVPIPVPFLVPAPLALGLLGWSHHLQPNHPVDKADKIEHFEHLATAAALRKVQKKVTTNSLTIPNKSPKLLLCFCLESAADNNSYL